LCQACAAADALQDVPAPLLNAAAADGLNTGAFAGRHAVGCPSCSRSGYKGRTGVHEFLPATPELRRQLSSGSVSPRDLRALASAHFRPLQYDALRRYWRGETSLAEVLALPAPEGDLLGDVSD
jgi:type II secretory ATPase GspE/PulE/Tfp pilus assembly ATPase PilB-like protein